MSVSNMCFRRYGMPFMAEPRSRIAATWRPCRAIAANFDPTQERREAAPDPLTALKEFPTALSTQEVATVMAQNNQMPDRDAAERALLELLGEGAVRHRAVGDGALWQPA